MPFDGSQHGHDPQRLGQVVDGPPQTFLELVGRRHGLGACLGVDRDGLLAPFPALRGAPVIDGEAPTDPNQPGAEAFGVPQRGELAIGADQRLLGDVFGVLSLSQDPVRNPECEQGRIAKSLLELLFQCNPVLLGHGAVSEDFAGPMHRVSSS